MILIFMPMVWREMLAGGHRAKANNCPQIVASNIVFSKNDPGDASLKQAFKDYPVKEYTIIERNGIRIGLFGIMGKDAGDDTPFAKPVTFADPDRDKPANGGYSEEQGKGGYDYLPFTFRDITDKKEIGR